MVDVCDGDGDSDNERAKSSGVPARRRLLFARLTRCVQQQAWVRAESSGRYGPVPVPVGVGSAAT